MGKLNTNTSLGILLQTDKVSGTTVNSSWTDTKYPDGDSFKNICTNLSKKYLPVGTILETTDASWTPDTSTGTWELIHSGETVEHVGTQVLHPGVSSSGQVGKTNISGCYHNMLFEYLYTAFEKPGHHVEFRVSTIGTTSGDRNIELYFNTLRLTVNATWSSSAYKVCAMSKRFKLSDIKKELTLNYTTEGINLGYITTATGSASNGTAWSFGDVCVHCYLVSDLPVYKWKRVS